MQEKRGTVHLFSLLTLPELKESNLNTRQQAPKFTHINHGQRF